MAKKKENWVSKLKESARLLLKGKKGVKHSPAGKKHLKKKKAEKKKQTQTVYFKTIKRKSDEQRLKEAGLSKEDLRSLGIK